MAAAAAVVLAIASVTTPRIAAALDRALLSLAKAATNLLSLVLASTVWAVAVLPVWGWGKVTRGSLVKTRLEDPRSSWAPP